MATPTPHIGANLGDVAKTVLMPGDPLRAKLLADTYLTDVKQFNTVRNMFGYTGYYKGVQVSVMGSGMGMPSIGIYSHELYNFYGVENILRIGSAGAINMNVKVRDIILAIGACTNSAFGEQFSLPGTFAPVASYDILKTADKKAEEMGLGVIVGNVLSSDTFYCDDASRDKDWQKMGVLAVEMEAAALYMNAARFGKKALAVLTVSDHILTGEALNAEDRQNSFHDMLKLSLETAISL
ncbi:MAG: purine-nucleoside phosphorylase [Clostridiales bacterium]|nr:purine-nucleoside phosphorylase [Clostridiales bacterium]MBQ2816402.1 purine-nucleoside phosphorylase [Clostridia bacterium]